MSFVVYRFYHTDAPGLYGWHNSTKQYETLEAAQAAYDAPLKGREFKARLCEWQWNGKKLATLATRKRKSR